MKLFERCWWTVKRRWMARLKYEIESCPSCAYSGPGRIEEDRVYCPNCGALIL